MVACSGVRKRDWVLAPHGAGEAVVRTMACPEILDEGTPRLAALDGALCDKEPRRSCLATGGTLWGGEAGEFVSLRR